MNTDFMTVTDIKRMLHIGHTYAKKIYDLAEEIDEDELKYRVLPHKVRRSSVERILTETKK